MRDDIESAFPTHGSMGECVQQGMSVRGYFASKAMQGICSHQDTWGLNIDEIASSAYEMADAMMKAMDV